VIAAVCFHLSANGTGVSTTQKRAITPKGNTDMQEELENLYEEAE